jgi:hypothetical protein
VEENIAVVGWHADFDRKIDDSKNKMYEKKKQKDDLPQFQSVKLVLLGNGSPGSELYE